MSNITLYWMTVMTNGKQIKKVGTFNYKDLIKLGHDAKHSNHDIHYSREKINLLDKVL